MYPSHVLSDFTLMVLNCARVNLFRFTLLLSNCPGVKLSLNFWTAPHTTNPILGVRWFWCQTSLRLFLPPNLISNLCFKHNNISSAEFDFKWAFSRLCIKIQGGAPLQTFPGKCMEIVAKLNFAPANYNQSNRKLWILQNRPIKTKTPLSTHIIAQNFSEFKPKFRGGGRYGSW